MPAAKVYFASPSLAPWPRGFFPGRWGSMRCRGEACLAPTRVGVGVGHARPEALRNKSDGHGTSHSLNSMDLYRRRLPHWFPEDAAVFMTWRLAGSIPPGVIRASRAARVANVANVAKVGQTIAVCGLPTRTTRSLSPARRAPRPFRFRPGLVTRSPHREHVDERSPVW